MKTLIAVPSYNRPYDIEKTTLHWLKKLPDDIEWKIFVREEQEMYYSQVTKNTIPIVASSYRETVQSIIDYANSNNYDLVYRVDDDMSFKTKKHSKKIDAHKAFLSIYNDVKDAFEENPHLGAVSVSKPMPFLYWKNDHKFSKNKIIYGNHIFRPKIHSMPEKVELLDDIVLTLNCVNQGYVCWRYMGGYENAVAHKNAGGLQSVDRDDITRKTIVELQKLFPDNNVQFGTYKDSNKIDVDVKQLKLKWREFI